jgi:hypothetical protein
MYNMKPTEYGKRKLKECLIISHKISVSEIQSFKKSVSLQISLAEET